MIEKDLSQKVKAKVQVVLTMPEDMDLENFRDFSKNGSCIDDYDISMKTQHLNPEYLSCGEKIVKETLYSNLLKCICPINSQPDLASIQIDYEGPQIKKDPLLKYILSFRQHTEVYFIL